MTYSESQDVKYLEEAVIVQDPISQGDNHDNRKKMGQSIIFSLIVAMFRDLKKLKSDRIDKGELGWRNKYNIHRLSGVSQKQIYKEYGIIEQLVENEVIEQRPSQSRWGKQKHQYRLNFHYIENVDAIIQTSLSSL